MALKDEVAAIAAENGWNDQTVLTLLCDLLEGLEGGPEGVVKYLRCRELLENTYTEEVEFDVLRGATQLCLSEYLSVVSGSFYVVLGDGSTYDREGSIYFPTSEEEFKISEDLDFKGIQMDPGRQILI